MSKSEPFELKEENFLFNLTDRPSFHSYVTELSQYHSTQPLMTPDFFLESDLIQNKAFYSLSRLHFLQNNKKNQNQNQQKSDAQNSGENDQKNLLEKLAEELIESKDNSAEGLYCVSFIKNDEELLKKVASLGYPLAKFRLAMTMIKKNEETEAYKILKFIVKRGVIEAIPEYCQLFVKRIKAANQQKDLIKYHETLLFAADRGVTEAGFSVGETFALGFGCIQSDTAAAVYYEKAANGGNQQAMVNLGNLYREGKGVPQNLQKALQLFLSANEIEQGLLNSSLMLMQGMGVPQDFQKAAECLQKAVNLGSLEAKKKLASLLIAHPEIDQSKLIDAPQISENQSDSEPDKNLQNSSKNSNQNSGQNSGKNSGKNSNKNEKNTKNSKKQNWENSENADLLRRDRGLRLLKEAADSGDPACQFSYGSQIMEKKHINFDQYPGREAEEYFKKAADTGIPEAQFRYALSCAAHPNQTPQKRKESFLYLKRAADSRKLPQSNFLLGLKYATGDGCGKSIDNALKEYTFAANGGVTEAMVNLGIMYGQGVIVKQNDEIASKYFKQAADLGNIQGLCNICLLYSQKKVIPYDEGEEMRYLKRALQLPKGMRPGPALFQMANYYSTGRPGFFNKDEKKAYELMKEAAECGVVEAVTNLAGMLKDGRGTEKNIQKAYQLYEEAAKRGISLAMVHLGVGFLEGKDVPQDIPTAIKWFREAADKGECHAMFYLGNIYGSRGQHEQSFKWMKKAADLGIAEAQVNIGNMYASGTGVGKSMVECAKYFRLACIQKLPEGIYNYGKLLVMQGNIDDGIKLLKEAAEKGFTQANEEIEHLIETGVVSADEFSSPEFRENLEQAESGNAEKMLEVGNAYSFGRGTLKNSQRGFEWVKKAADQGLDKAMMRCAIMLEKGEGTEPNLDLAIEYYHKAADAGIAFASKRLAALQNPKQ